MKHVWAGKQRCERRWIGGDRSSACCGSAGGGRGGHIYTFRQEDHGPRLRHSRPQS